MVKSSEDESSRAPHMLTVRITSEMLKALDLEVTRLRAERPGGHVQRSDVVREILGHRLLANPTESEGRQESEGAARRRRGSRLGRWQSGETDGGSPKRLEKAANAIAERIRLTFSLVRDDVPKAPLLDDAAVDFLLEHLTNTLADEDDRQAVVDLIHQGPVAVVDAIAEVVRRGSLSEFGPNRLTGLGGVISYALRKKVLLAELDAAQWSLSEAAANLGLGAGASAILRMIRDLGLSADHTAAKEAGMVRRGPRPGTKREP